MIVMWIIVLSIVYILEKFLEIILQSIMPFKQVCLNQSINNPSLLCQVNLKTMFIAQPVVAFFSGVTLLYLFYQIGKQQGNLRFQKKLSLSIYNKSFKSQRLLTESDKKSHEKQPSHMTSNCLTESECFKQESVSS